MESLKQGYRSFADRFLRNSRKPTDMVLIAISMSFLMALVGMGLSSVIMNLPGMPFNTRISSPEEAVTYMDVASLYFGFIGIWLLVLLAIIIPKANRPMLKDILPNRRGNTLWGIIFGLVMGFSLNAICVILSIILGDIGLSFAEFDAVKLLVIFATVLVQSGAEEIIDRQFLYEKLRRRYKSVPFAIVVQAAVFTAMHAFNPGMTIVSVLQIFAVGIIFALFVCYFDGLWAAIFFHTSWNFTQNIIFGCPNSGAVSGYSIFRLDAASYGPFFDPVFGVEGSVGAVAILFAFMILLLVYIKKKDLQPRDLWADMDQPSGAEALPTGSAAEHGGRHFA
ncbi:MAG: CPBP family intramembrane metalloprotease [Atopobiaceae bacterium]|nr:CPBP family intramembrane metalloprotease [Atopobiaceae bacterium]